MQSLTTGVGISSRLLTIGHSVAEVFTRSVSLYSCTAKAVPHKAPSRYCGTKKGEPRFAFLLGDLFQGSTEKTIADSAISPITTTNTFDTWPEYWRRDGTRRMAYIGIRNSRQAMIGPPRVSIMPRMLGLKVATAQQVRTMNSAVLRSSHLADMERLRPRRDLTIKPWKPSLAPM